MRVAVFLAVLVGGAGVVAGLGAWERTDGGAALERWWSGVPDRTYASVSVTFTVQDDGRIVASDGTEVGQVAKTQVVSDDSFTCTVNIPALALERMIASNTGVIEIVAGGRAEIRPSEVEIEGEMVSGVLCVAWTGGYGDPFEEEFLPADEEGGISGLDVIIEVTGYYIDRETSAFPTSPRVGSPVYAVEVVAEDELTMGEETTINVTVGPAFASDTPASPVSTAYSVFFATDGAWHTSFLATTEECPMTFYEITDCAIWGGALNLDGMVVESSGDGLLLQIVGDGDTVRFILQDEVHSYAEVSQLVHRPHNIDFADFGVWDRDGTLLDDLLIWGAFRKSALYSVTEKEGYDYGELVPLTVGQIRGIGHWTARRAEDVDPEEDEYQLWTGPLQFTIDEESAKAHGLNPKDLTIEMRVPPLSATSCDAEPDVEGLMTLVFNDGAGIYGPPDPDTSERALDHEDWVPGGGAIAPTSSGQFEVTGEPGSLTLPMPNNFGSRMQAVPDQNFPEGMAGWPLQYMLHEAGIWREYDGEECPDETLHSEPLEARYCWRGVPCLTVPVDAPSTYVDPMFVTVKYRTWAITDTRVTGETRQTDAGAVSTNHERTYRVHHVAETNLVYLGVPLEGGGEPDLEDVYEMAITNIPIGEHELDEPKFARDPEGGESILIKVMESPRDEYEHGGFSAPRVDHVCRHALMDSHETNGGHSTKLEPTVRMFDHIKGVVSGLDHTAAWGRVEIANLLDQVTEAFSCAHDDAEFDAHYQDDEDAYMTGGYAFDFCHPLEGASRPLEQEIGGVNFAVRCGSWEIVPGPVYKVWTDKVVEGSMYGYMLIEDEDRPDEYVLARDHPTEEPDSPAPTVDRRPMGGTLESWWTGTTDSAGHWRSQSGEVYESFDPDTLWQYLAGDYVTRFASRELAYAEMLVVPIIPRHLHLSEHTFGPLFLTDGHPNAPDVGFRMRRPGTGWEGRLVVVTDAHQVACAAVGPSSGPHIIRDTETGAVAHEVQSMTGSWMAQVALEAGYTWPDVGYAWSRWWVAAYKDDEQHLLRRRRAGDFAAVDARTIAASAEAPACLVTNTPQGRMLCAIERVEDEGEETEAREAAVYVSNDLGASWFEAFTVEDYRWPRLIARDGFLWLLGVNSDGAVKVQRRQLFISALPLAPFPDASTEALVSATSMKTRPAFHAMRVTGDLVCVLQETGGGLAEFRSYNMGHTWKQTVAIA